MTNNNNFKFAVGDRVITNKSRATGTIFSVVPASDKLNHTGRTLYAVQFDDKKRGAEYLYTRELEKYVDPAVSTKQSTIEVTTYDTTEDEWKQFYTQTNKDWNRFVNDK